MSASYRLTPKQLKDRSQQRRLASRQVMKEVFSSPPLQSLKQTMTILSISTFPKRFEPLRDRVVALIQGIDELKKHPDFESLVSRQDLDPDEIVRSVENRLWTIFQNSPWWFGRLAKDKPKKPASPAQLKALAKARQRKQVLQDEAEAPYVPGSQNLTEIRCETTMTGEELTDYLRS